MWRNIKITFLITFAIVLNAGLWQPTQAGPVKNPRAAGNQTLAKDDLTTQYAKEIIRLAKAADVSATLDTKVSPCDDFYKYACGNWHRSNPAQLMNSIMTDRFQMIAKSFDRRLETLLNEPPDADRMASKVKNFYHSCQVAKSDDLLYKLELENVYKEFGEFPLLAGDKWQEADFNWWETIAKIQHIYGKQIILAVDIMGDIKNNTENKIYIGPSDYSESSNTKLLSVLQEITIIHDLEGFGVEHELAKKTAKELIELERELVHGGTDVRLGLSLEELLSLKNVEELQETYNNSLDIKKYMQLVLGSQVPDSIYVYDEKYLENMFRIVDGKPKYIVANYILWQLLQEYLIDSSPEELPKWCTERTKKYFGKYVDYLVYQRYKSNETEQEVYDVWRDIRSSFHEELRGDKLDWISNDTRAYAIEKLNTMELHINSYENENLTEEYAQLKIDSLKYVVNVQQILKHESGKVLRKLHEPATSLEDTEVLSFTPAYNILENVIKIPVGLMQPRFFWDTNYPQALKYGTLGYLIAHELVHGFDDDGRNYDKHGNFRNWWDKKSTYEFEERRKCFQAQYHNYKYGGRHLPESISQSENIADNAGIKLAYAAYQRWLRKQSELDADIARKETLPTLQFDNQQLFFVGFAQVWCEDVQSLFKSSVASGDTHAPGMYRVIGSLSNFQEFSWVFKCKQDAPMDPEFKCAIY